MADQEYNAKNVLDEYLKQASRFTLDFLLSNVGPIIENTNTLLEAVEEFQKTREVNDVLKNFIGTNAILSKENNASVEVIAKKVRGRPKQVLQESTQIQIKQEKVSDVSSIISNVTVKLEKIDVKKEKQDMPAPTILPPRRKKVKQEVVDTTQTTRTTRTRGKNAKIRDSDIQIAESPITTIDLADSDESIVLDDQNKKTSKKKPTAKNNVDTESETETDKEEKRSTRTRTMKKATKTKEAMDDTISSSEIAKKDESVRSTRTRTKAKKAAEEPVSETNPLESTFVLPKSKQNKDQTSKANKDTETDAPVRSTRTRTIKKPKIAEEEKEEAKEETERNVQPQNIVNKEAAKANAKSSPVEENSKRSRSESPCPEDINAADKKRKSDVNANISSKTQYEDAVSSLESTYTATSSSKAQEEEAPKAAAVLNSTVVVEIPKIPVAKSLKVVNPDPLLTEDESENEIKTPPRKINKSKIPKEVFSPYEKTTLKKKVEAFEKLNSGASTRSSKTGSAIKVKPYTTPLSKFKPMVSSTSKVEKVLSSFESSNAGNESTLVRPNSALKASQKEFRERQLREKEALKKKEAMLQAATEEKRRKNQEKQLKAQQQRKVIEIEKQKQLEILKKKDEEKKQLLAARDEYLQKQREEMEKLRQQKKQEMEAKRHKEQETRKPIFLVTETPLLPTDDCYDSDDSEYKHSQKKYVEPKWCKESNLRHQQFVMLAAGEKIKNTLFCRSAVTPDLRELLDVVDDRVLRRNSSAVWRKAPRYTLVAGLDGTRFSEDEEDS